MPIQKTEHFGVDHEKKDEIRVDNSTNGVVHQRAHIWNTFNGPDVAVLEELQHTLAVKDRENPRREKVLWTSRVQE